MVHRPYTVEGRWPFPLDMLRRDGAHAASPADKALIDRMSGEVSDDEIGLDPVSINLVMEGGEKLRGLFSRHRPNAARWQSFGWDVTADPEIVGERRYLAAMAASETERNRLRRQALAKLTDDEIEALGLGRQPERFQP